MGHLTLPSENLIGSYVNGIVVAFFENYIAQNKEFRPYFQSSYAEYLSKGQNFKLNFVTAASSQSLADAIAQFK